MTRETTFGSRAPGARWRLAAWAGAAVLVVVPVVVWWYAAPFDLDPGHGVMAALVTVLSGLAYETAVRLPARLALAGGIALSLAGAMLMLWANGAVGILGSEDDPVNRIFLWPVGLALAGALAAAMRPALASSVLVLAAFAQVGTFVHALVGGHGFVGPITVFFCFLWLAASTLFRRAGRHRARHGAIASGQP
jgi:hypothetical protein